MANEPDIRTSQIIAELQERLRLQELISDISAILMNLPAEEVDGQIENALKRLVEFLGVDRSAFGEYTEDTGEPIPTHSYTLPGIEPPLKVPLRKIFPWYGGKILSSLARIRAQNEFLHPIYKDEEARHPLPPKKDASPSQGRHLNPRSGHEIWRRHVTF